MTESQTPADDVFDVARIRDLIELMKEFELNEIDLRQQQQRIRLCRGGSAAAPIVAASPIMHAPAHAVAPAPLSAAASDAPRATDDASIAVIRSPMVGTFYSRSNPKSEPFVKVGDRVDRETTVCIVEAMKVFNEIPAEVSGTIVAILADEEEAVDFGRPLFKVDISK
jgi:acetyl-CoA carboxylase biotin carboxyl carrier protein